jgi:hypothetical protein
MTIVCTIFLLSLVYSPEHILWLMILYRFPTWFHLLHHYVGHFFESRGFHGGEYRIRSFISNHHATRCQKHRRPRVLCWAFSIVWGIVNIHTVSVVDPIPIFRWLSSYGDMFCFYFRCQWLDRDLNNISTSLVGWPLRCPGGSGIQEAPMSKIQSNTRGYPEVSGLSR